MSCFLALSRAPGEKRRTRPRPRGRLSKVYATRHVAGTPGPERTETARGSHVVGGLLSRSVYSVELLLCPLRLVFDVHAFRPRPAVYYVAVLLAPVLVGFTLAPEPGPGAFGHAPEGRADFI